MWYLIGRYSGCNTASPDAVDGVGSNYYTNLTSNASAYTKGSWVTFDSPEFDSMLLVTHGYSQTVQRVFVDIALGSTEVVIWENILFHNSAISYRAEPDCWWMFPTVIPAGETVKARVSSSATGTYYTGIKLNYFPITGDRLAYPSCVHTYGADTASNEGVAVDPGGTIETKGDWSEITSATTHPYQGFKIGFTTSGANTALANADWHVDIGFGAASSEEVVIDGFRLQSSTVYDIMTPHSSPLFPIPIPEGTRVAARASCDINDATDRLFDVILYGVG